MRKIAAKHIHAAEIRIMRETGMHLTLQVAQKKRAEKDDMYVLMGVVAEALGMNIDDYFEGRKKELVDLRCLATIFLQRYYPETPLMTFAKAYGLNDHSTIINYNTRAARLLETNDEDFSQKYDLVVEAIDNWLNKNDEHKN